jgi:hypothetical protein
MLLNKACANRAIATVLGGNDAAGFAGLSCIWGFLNGLKNVASPRILTAGGEYNR